MEFISASGRPYNTIHANNFEFYEELHSVIGREPLEMLDPELRGLFASIGIQKGKPFAPDERMGGRNLDARTLFYYFATVNTPAMAMKIVGAGSQYAWGYLDSDGNHLDGGKTDKLNIPKDAPALKFWSVVVYDPQTRSELQTDQTFPSKQSQRDDLIVNEDGSIDLYFGPNPPAGMEANWTQTVPGKGWFSLLRLYSPTEAWFDTTWRPSEIELVK